jgi:hypothetical protein
MFGSN